ncbi:MULTISPECIES: hypothetical protein [unclassified Variovorax]|jgi:hypothetical protein|uniref:hypothetical protein n=1 Tax=unclassified Variovorax TaxID=663243 RepID=UPI000C3FCF77|nr:MULTISPECIES: hypothetical protein [unclassified Variovorax]MBS79530.1 hypothetical protein [Variovorax sp.]MCT8180876.1 hypothetical protein [Variovorax sp. CY25R-8]
MRGIACALAPGLLALAGCAGLGTSHADFVAGWRTGRVEALGRAGELAHAMYRDCAPQAGANEPYAVVRYHDGGLRTRALGTTRLPPDLRVGDTVRVDVRDCSAPLELLSRPAPADAS